MIFEPENEILIVKCGLPESKLFFVDWKQKKVLSHDGDLSTNEKILDIQINPHNISQILLLKQNSVEIVEFTKNDFIFFNKGNAKVCV